MPHDPERDLGDATSPDALFWAIWSEYPDPEGEPLPPGGRDRDRMVFMAGAVAALVALHGEDEGKATGLNLMAGLLLRDALSERMAAEGES